VATTENKKKYVTLTSEKGVAVWPWLNAPDTKFDARGVYKVQLAHDPNDAKQRAYLDALEEAHEQAVAVIKKENPKLKNSLNVNPVTKAEVNDEGDETGRVLVSFKMYATSQDPKTKEVKTRVPRFFDAKGKPLVKPPRIGGGSVLKLAYQISPYLNGKNAGITLYLSAVQIIELVEFGGGGSAAAFGFGQEDGFAVEEESEAFGAEETAGDEAVNGDF
jgi:hypothetical protein